jgi:hypothetical protein
VAAAIKVLATPMIRARADEQAETTLSTDGD